MNDKTKKANEARTDAGSRQQARRGRAYVPNDQDRKLVEVAVALKIPEVEIAKLVSPPDGISPDELRRHYPLELALSTARMNLTVANMLYEMATSDSIKPPQGLKAAMRWLELCDPQRWRCRR
jgi:hypothetical protein